MAEIMTIEQADEAQVQAFFQRVPEGDRTFFKEDVTDPDLVRSWTRDSRGRRAVACDNGTVVGYVAVIPGLGWSSHVGGLRLVVDADQRGKGLGRALARRGLLDALELGLSKIVVEVVADQTAAAGMFQAIGFEPEAMLRNQVRDRDGELRDLLVLAHHPEDAWSGLATAGVEDALA
ncbi:MAG: GNAT family N-acetyltransferase [Mycobacteriales bacterium]